MYRLSQYQYCALPGREQVKSEQEALNLLYGGELMRTTAMHNLNKKSNRSHSIFTVHITQRARSGVSEKARPLVAVVNHIAPQPSLRQRCPRVLHTVFHVGNSRQTRMLALTTVRPLGCGIFIAESPLVLWSFQFEVDACHTQQLFVVVVLQYCRRYAGEFGCGSSALEFYGLRYA